MLHLPGRPHLTRATKYDRESAIVTRLFAAVGLPCTSMTDPMVTHGGETGADVEVRIAGRSVGVQVTEYCADEGIADPGSGLRATERGKARRGEFAPTAIPLEHQLTSLRGRVSDKVEKSRRYTFQKFDEVWLLVAASLAQPGAIVSTFLVSQLLTPGDVNRSLDDELVRHSKYAQVFIHMQIGDTIYHWTRESSWHLIHGAGRPDPTGGEPWFKSFLPPFPPPRT